MKQINKITYVFSVLFVCAPLLVAANNSTPAIERLSGEPGYLPKFGCGWVDLDTATNFHQGHRLRLKIGGTAKKILIRLLPDGSFPDSSAGIVGNPVDVPTDRIVEIELKVSHKNVIQISVHGGPNPWGRFPLGGGNGPASLEFADYVHR